MKLRKIGLLASVLGAFLGFGPAAHSQLWTWSFTDTDIGASYSLTDFGGGSTIHTYTLNVDTSGYTKHADPSFLDAVNIKAWSAGSADVSFVLTSTNTFGGTAGWSPTEGPINNGSGGCGGTSSGFACVEAVNKGVFNVDANGSFYSFTFQVRDGTASFFSTAEGAHVGAGYADSSGAGASYGITSMTMAIPEPEIYAMLLMGLGVMGFVTRRKRQEDAPV